MSTLQHEHYRSIPKPKSWEPTDQDQENCTKYETRITCVHEYDGEEREVVGPGVGGQGGGDPAVQNETGEDWMDFWLISKQSYTGCFFLLVRPKND